MGFQAESAGVTMERRMVDADKMFIDSHRQVIQLNYDMGSRIKAEGRNKYYHFCSLSTLDSILESRAIKLNNIGHFEGADEYERKNVEPEFWGQVFVACLTSEPRSKELWNDFGDNGRGVRIDFSFPSIFHTDVFDKKRLVRAFGTDGKEYVELGFAASTATHPSLTCNPNRFTQPIVDISLMDVNYTNTAKASSIYIDDGKALNISSVSTDVPCAFLDEYETRVRGILRCTHDVYMPPISYLLVPINLKYMSIMFGKKVGTEDRQYYSKMLEALKTSEEQDQTIL